MTPIRVLVDELQKHLPARVEKGQIVIHVANGGQPMSIDAHLCGLKVAVDKGQQTA